MSHTRHAIELGSEIVGHAVSLGARYVFYTSHPKLERLNAHRFDTLESVRAVVARTLEVSTVVGPMWHPESLMTEEEITELMNDKTFDDDPRAAKRK